MMAIYALWRYLDEWELVRLSTDLNSLRRYMSEDSFKWTLPVMYKLTTEIVFGQIGDTPSAPHSEED